MRIKGKFFEFPEYEEESALVSADGFSEEQSVALWLKKYAKHNQQWLDFQCSEFDQ